MAAARVRIGAIARPADDAPELPDTGPADRALADAELVHRDHVATHEGARKGLVHARAQVARAHKLREAGQRWMALRERTVAAIERQRGLASERARMDEALGRSRSKSPKRVSFSEDEIEIPMIGDVRRALLDAEKAERAARQAITAFEHAGTELENARTLALDERDACRFERLTEARSARAQMREVLRGRRLLHTMRSERLDEVEAGLTEARARTPSVQVEQGKKPDASPFRTANARLTQAKRKVQEIAGRLDGWDDATVAMRDRLEDLEDASDDLRRRYGRRKRRVNILESELPDHLRTPKEPKAPKPVKKKPVDDLMAWVKSKKQDEPEPAGLDDAKTTVMSPEEIRRQLEDDAPAGLDEGKTTMMSPEELERLKKELLGED